MYNTHSSSAQLPAIIDPNKAITSFLHNREDLRRILCAELLRVTGELYAKGIISTETHTKASHLMYTPDERSMILLNAVESKMRVESSIFTEFVHILESEPYTNFLANALVQSYSELALLIAIFIMDTEILLLCRYMYHST